MITFPSLAAFLAEHERSIIDHGECVCGEWSDLSADHFSHALHVAAAWRESRTIRTVDGLRDLLRYTLIAHRGVPMRRNGNRHHPWTSLSTGMDHCNADVLPALILWLPGEDAT